MHDLDVEEESYFSLDKGEKLTYNIVADPKSDKNLEVFADLIVEEKSKDADKVTLKLSEKPCYYYKGCKL